MGQKGKFISLSAIGLDSPGLVAKITNKIFEMGGNVIDVEENCRRGLFSIFLIIDFSASPHSIDTMTTALQAVGDESGLKVVLGIYDEKQMTYMGHKENHIVNILGEDKPGIIAKVSTFYHKYHINIESCRMIARGKFFSMEMAIDTSSMLVGTSSSRREAVERMKAELKALCRELNQSVVIQSEDIYRKGKKLVVFDVESTLIQESSLTDFLERIRGELGSVKAGKEFEEAGEDRMQALVHNARMLKGFPLSDFGRFSDILQLNSGTLELIRILKSMGFKIALLSSGFNFFVKRIFEAAGVDYAFSNTLRADDKGLLTGELEEPVITNETKGEILEFIMNVENLQPDQVIAVGDGSTRSHFIENVGLSIAFKPDEGSINTDGILSGDQITNILYCLGIPKTELDRHLKKKSS
jgi:phosphoserine phosphatase